MRAWLILSVLLLALQLGGCATNPVTGRNELALVSESQELAIGARQYAPSRQMQGGDYILDPQLSAYVQEVGQKLAAVSDRQLPYEFSLLNDSTPNAWALPGGKIAINRGLLVELENEAELAAVLGHEIVHAAARHGAKGMERGLLLQGAILVAGAAASGSDYSQLAVGAAAVGANLINQSYSRDAESESDYYGMLYMVRAGYDPQAAIGLQETFVRLSQDKQPNWLAGLFASHPPSQERVEANRRTAQSLPAGGELGRERYRKMTAYLRKVQPAYAAHDKGREALHNKSYMEALQLAEQAIAMEPREGLFHALKGDVLAARGEHARALAHYDKAVELNPDYFRHHLQRGTALNALGRRAQAQQELQRSVQLLPTADAHYALGQLALNKGDRVAALDHFRMASEGSSPQARAAAIELVQLDLPQHPESYLHTSLGVREGRLVVAVENATALAVEGVELILSHSSGRQHDLRLGQRLQPGQILRFTTQIAIPDQKTLRRWQARVSRARLTDR